MRPWSGRNPASLRNPARRYVALAQPAPERYDTCSSLTYPEWTGKPIPLESADRRLDAVRKDHGLAPNHGFDHRRRPFRPLCNAQDHYLEGLSVFRTFEGEYIGGLLPSAARQREPGPGWVSVSDGGRIDARRIIRRNRHH